MANGFDYEAPINKLLSVTVPQFLDKQLDRQESSRRFDKQLLAQVERDNLAQDRFDKEFEFKENQTKEQILFTSIKEADTISGRNSSLENEGLGFKTDLFKNKIKIEKSNLNKLSESNKKEVEIYSSINPRLGDIASARADNIDMNMEGEVLKFLQVEGAANAQRGSAITLLNCILKI